MNANNTQLAWYADILKGWQTKLMGSKPTADMFKTVHGWGNRPGSEALHLAMCLRPEGCTVRQFCIAGSCGPANNKRGLMIKRGLATVSVTGKPYAFTLKATAKGLALVKANEAKALAAADKATVKAKGKGATKAPSKGKGSTKRKPAPSKAPAPVNAPAPAPEAQGGNVPPAGMSTAQLEQGGHHTD